jgi:RecG-like helicase
MFDTENQFFCKDEETDFLQNQWQTSRTSFVSQAPTAPSSKSCSPTNSLTTQIQKKINKNHLSNNLKNKLNKEEINNLIKCEETETPQSQNCSSLHPNTELGQYYSPKNDVYIEETGMDIIQSINQENNQYHYYDNDDILCSIENSESERIFNFDDYFTV